MESQDNNVIKFKTVDTAEYSLRVNKVEMIESIEEVTHETNGTDAL
jgi:hypothetical protein